MHLMYTNQAPDPASSGNPDRLSCLLGRCLDSQRDEIIDEWLKRVLMDPAIPTESLSPEQIGLHFPDLLDELTDTLSHGRMNGAPCGSGRDGWPYGAARWRQGFQLPEMLRELTHLRCIILERVVQLEEDNGTFGTGTMLLATNAVHRFVDRMGIEAITHFLTEGVAEREMVTAAA